MKLTEQILTEFITRYASSRQGAEQASLDVSRDTDLSDLGLDSVDVVILTAEMEDQYGIVLDPAFFLRHRTIRLIMEELHQNGLA